MAMSGFLSNPRLRILTGLAAIFFGAAVAPVKACDCAPPIYYSVPICYSAPIYHSVPICYSAPIYYGPSICYAPPIYYSAPVYYGLPICSSPPFSYGPPITVIRRSGKTLSIEPQTEAKEGKVVQSPKVRKLAHANFALYELREAKEDVRDLKDFPADRKKKLLGAIDDTIAKLKEIIKEATGKEADYTHPGERPVYANWKHLRHSVKMLKAAKEQVKIEKAISDESRAKAMRQINICLELLENALDHAK